ncbi:MAG: hypothetical protein WA949_09385 [Phormidesmis sp.]
MLRTRLKFWLKRVTPLTWLIWALLLSDLSAPGYLKFNLVFTQFDAIAFVEKALADR